MSRQLLCDENMIAFPHGDVTELVDVLHEVDSSVYVVIPVANDVFDKWTQEQRDQLWRMIESRTRAIWLLMTRKVGKIMCCVPIEWDVAFPSNVVIGIEAHEQDEADAMMRTLVRVPVLRYVAVAPGVDMSNWLPFVDEVGTL